MKRKSDQVQRVRFRDSKNSAGCWLLEREVESDWRSESGELRLAISGVRGDHHHQRTLRSASAEKWAIASSKLVAADMEQSAKNRRLL